MPQPNQAEQHDSQPLWLEVMHGNNGLAVLNAIQSQTTDQLRSP
jgi:hypothetical protein